MSTGRKRPDEELVLTGRIPVYSVGKNLNSPSAAAAAATAAAAAAAAASVTTTQLMVMAVATTATSEPTEQCSSSQLLAVDVSPFTFIIDYTSGCGRNGANLRQDCRRMPGSAQHDVHEWRA